MARLLVTALALMLPLAAGALGECALEKSEHVYSNTPNGALKAYVFSPVGQPAKPRAAVVLFHGGGWVAGEPPWAFWLVDRYACKGMTVVVAQYRLSDQKTASPAEASDDAMAAIKWTRESAAKFHLDRNRIASLGWSAGAHLAASAAVFANDKAQRPDLLAFVSPALSVVNDKHFRALFPPEVSISDFSPAQHVKPSLPPAIIVTGRTDTVTPLAEVSKFHERMLEAGNVSVLKVFDGVGHLFTPAGEPDDRMPKPDLVIQAQAYAAIDAFLIAHGYRDP